MASRARPPFWRDLRPAPATGACGTLWRVLAEAGPDALTSVEYEHLAEQMNARMLRLAGGPDAVRRRVTARGELRRHFG